MRTNSAFEYFAYDYTKSETQTGVDHSSRVSISFGSGDLGGIFITDHCMLGDIDNPDNQLLIEDFSFGLVEK